MASRIVGSLKVLVIGYVVTALMLCCLALCVYKFGWGAKQIDIGVLFVYGVSSLVGGFLLAYRERHRRLICGLAFGGVYCAILCVVSLIVGGGSIDVAGMLKCIIVSCVCGGIGGVFVK